MQTSLNTVMHLWPFSKSKFNLKSDRVNLVAAVSPIEYLLYLPNVWAIQYKLGPDGLPRLGNHNALQLPVQFFWVFPRERFKAETPYFKKEKKGAPFNGKVFFYVNDVVYH